MYWVDIYRLANIFVSYFIATHQYKTNKMEDAYQRFETLLNKSFAPTLPYLAVMKFKGLGSSINIEAAKYHCERAIRNDYHECLYILAVIDFFGNNLSDYYKKIYHSTYDLQPKIIPNNSPNSKNKTFLKHSNIEIFEPDYKECVFHIEEYFKLNSEKQEFYKEACALYGYCLTRGLGIKENKELGLQYLNKAKQKNSSNILYLEECIKLNQLPKKYDLSLYGIKNFEYQD
ncbi:MAG: SEL1-like repeat protein [Succinivibrionaceae bacterium]